MQRRTWDSIVIGSGVGGLTAATALARAGQSVLVLEQHYLPGGWTHSFSLSGYRFSPGVHYVGELGPRGGLRSVYEGLGLSRDLEFCELNPDGFDHVFIAGERFDQPSGLERWKSRLIARFPDERKGIERYLSTLDHIATDLKRCDSLLRLPAVLAMPLLAPSLTRWGLSTVASLLDRCVRDRTLKALLTSRVGNHGLPASRASLAVHAAMMTHYSDGGFYPRGGGRSISRAYIRELRRRGSEIRLRSRVRRVSVRAGRATGVELEGGERLDAGSVICNADPAVAYGKLLDAEHCPRELRKVRRTEYSLAVISGFCAVDMDLKTMGYDSGNYWWYRTDDVDGVYARAAPEPLERRLDGLFLTVTTLKDPGTRTDRLHTLEMFAFVPFSPFARWQASSHDGRSPEYEEMKRRLGDRMLDVAGEIIPGLRERVRFFTVGTPLTNDHYCETFHGACYGTAKTPGQLGPFSFSQRGPVDGLYLCGASTLSHGIGGATMSGLLAARRVLGARPGVELLSPPDGSLAIYPADHPEAWLGRSSSSREAFAP